MLRRLQEIARKLDDAQNGDSDALYDARSELQDVMEDLQKPTTELVEDAMELLGKRIGEPHRQTAIDVIDRLLTV